MIARFRRRFVLVCMLSVTAVLIALLLVLNIVYGSMQTGRLDRLLKILVENGGGFPAMQPPDADRSGDIRIIDEFNPEARFTTRFFTVTFAEDGSVAASNVESVAAVGKDEAEALAEKAYAAQRKTGWADAYRYRYRMDDGIVVFVDASSATNAMWQLAVASFAITLSALLAIFLLMVIFARLAARPIAESLRKQRQFITDASHELKTPLTIISANAEIIEMNTGESEWSRSISKQTVRMAKLIQNLIDLTRIDEGAKRFVTARFNLSDAVYDTAMPFTTPAARRGLTVSVETFPDVYAQGDEGAARQLFSILMDNAVKYAKSPGEIKVRLTLAGKYAYLAVTNPYEAGGALKTDRLFDRFYRANEARTGDGSYGLGLSIAQSIVDGMKGKITAACADGRFTITVRFYAKQ